MSIRRNCFAVLLGWTAAVLCGCHESKPGPVEASDSAPSRKLPASTSEVVARIHWLGKKRLGSEANATNFMSIWNLPESARLEEQTLGKLAVAPWRLLRGVAETNASGALLRPVLDDLVQEESYVEIRHLTNKTGENVFAIRLNSERAGLWQTNLATAVESLTGVRTAAGPGGWSLRKHDAPNLVELTRAGDWTLVGMAQETNTLLGEFVTRIQRNHAPFDAPATNFWLDADVDVRRAASALSLDWSLPWDLPRISVAVIGDGENVRTRGELDFAKPLGFALEPWGIPTNLIHEPLVSFTAVQGLRPWLASLKQWTDLELGPPPNQLFFWAQEGAPMLTYFAAPSPNASNCVYGLTEFILQEGNQLLATNGMGKFKRSPNADGVVWGEMPFMSPFLQSAAGGDGGFVFGGLMPSGPTQSLPPAELLVQLLGRTNIVWYDWEITQARIESWIYLGQLFRLVFDKAQLPAASGGLAWLRAAAPKLGNCVTTVTRTNANQLTFIRKSSAGLTALEMHLLTDWLESPQFPSGSHTSLMTPETRRRKGPPAGVPVSR